MDATLTFTVTDDDTAEAIGSGSLPVLGTPRLLAWCEAATCAAIDPSLEEGSTSVGTRIALDHQGPSPVGQEVEVTASSAYVDGRLHRFTVSARDAGSGKVLAAGEITRVVVDAERFLAPGGTLIPASIVQWVAPVRTDRFERDLRSWREVGFGLDWSDAELVDQG